VRRTVNTRISSWKTTTWAVVAWNVFTVVWLLAGHPGVSSTTGEGNILAVLLIVVLWLFGNLTLGAVAVLRRRRPREEA